MPISGSTFRIHRRAFLGAGLAALVSRFASPFVITARAAEVVKIGLDNPLTGPLAALGKNELIGCQMAIDEINGKGGILGRAVALAVEDSTSGDAGTAVQKARKLIESDNVDFLLGSVNSALSLAIAMLDGLDWGPLDGRKGSGFVVRPLESVVVRSALRPTRSVQYQGIDMRYGGRRRD
jgi:Periplasmic binding protein